MKIFAKILRYVLSAAVFAVIAFLLWRIWFVNHDSTLDTIIPTDAVCAEYSRGDEAVFLYNPVHDRLSSGKEGADGYFSGYGFVYLPEKEEIQVTIRMNDSTLEKLSLDEVPYFFLKIYDNFSYDDENPNVQIRECTRVEEYHKLMYSYRRLVFEDVEIGETNDLLVCLSTDGTSAGGVSELVIHFREQELEPYKLSRADKKAIEGEIAK